MAKTSGSYICSTCGVATTGKGHLCNPVKLEKLTACKYCGRLADNPRHVCVPMVIKIKYACGNCGRVATSRNFLCNPQPIPKAIKKATKVKVGAR
jgi:DNA-directed RNA polymerase subunit RPC12/RpoP